MSASKPSFTHSQRSAIGIVVLALTVFIVLFSGVQSLNREEVETVLKRLNTHLANHASRNGKEASLSYGTIEMHGWGYDKVAKVSNVSLEVAQKSLLDTARIALSTESMEMGRDRASNQKTHFHFADPINIIESGQLTKIVTASAPVVYSFAQEARKGNVTTHTVVIPEQMIFSPAQRAGEQQMQDRVVVSMKPGEVLNARINDSTGEINTRYHVAGMKVITSTEEEFRVDEISGQYTQKVAGNDTVSGKYEWRVSNVVFVEGQKVSEPLSLVLDATYQGEEMKVDMMHMHPTFRNVDMTIQKVALLGKEFSIIGTGQVSTADDDPLPYGNLDVEIVNPDKFLASDFIPGTFKGVLKAAMRKVSADKVDASARASVPLKRDKNGVFYIGGVTFEEVTAAMLGDLLQSAMPSAAAPQEVPQVMPALPEGAPALEDMTTEAPSEENAPQGEAPQADFVHPVYPVPETPPTPEQ